MGIHPTKKKSPSRQEINARAVDGKKKEKEKMWLSKISTRRNNSYDRCTGHA
jgi:hypothetical protein